MTIPAQTAKVAIISDDPGWHGQQLASALKKRGVSSQHVSLAACRIVIGDGEQLIFPGFAGLPAAVFVRGIPGGSLEQVIFRLNILHALSDLGITVYNPPRAIERAVDKPLTSLLLHRAGLLTPATWICESMDEAQAILKRETHNGQRLVQKPLFGSQGIGMHLVDSATGLMHDEKFAGVYYLQRFIARPPGHYDDIRVFVIAGRAHAAMLRQGASWLSNRSQGADCKPLTLARNIAELAEAACQVLAMDYAGVDIIQDQNGRFYIIEVNSMPAWYGLQQVTGVNIAEQLIAAFIGRCPALGNLKS